MTELIWEGKQTDRPSLRSVRRDYVNTMAVDVDDDEPDDDGDDDDSQGTWLLNNECLLSVLGRGE